MEIVTYYDEELKIWSGPQKTADYLELEGIDNEKSIGEQAFERMQLNSERICQITDPDGTILTHGEMLELGTKIALYLRKLNMTKDDVVGIIAKNSTMILPIALGCWLNCTPFLALYPQSDRKEIAQLFGLTKPKLVFSDATDYAELIEGCKLINLSPKIITIDENITGVPILDELLQVKTDFRDFQPTKLEEGPDQTSIYMCSSGTTGIPKCMHISNLQILAEFRPVHYDHTFFTFSQLSWISSVTNFIVVLLSGSARVVTSAPPDPELHFELIPKYKMSHITVTPDLLTQMVKCYYDKPRDLTSVLVMTSSGSVITEPIIKQAYEMLTDGILLIVYGATEFGSTTINVHFEKPKSAGNLLPEKRVKITNDAGQPLGVGEVGEILVHNGRAWRGYVDNAKETAAMQDAEGWFHSGDLGYFDADACLYIVDRKKDALKFRGITYSPSEIEHIIAELSDVIEVCVFGVRHDIDVDRAAAAVILKKKSRLTEDEIRQYVAGKLPYHLHLHGGVYFMNDFPRTGSNKVMRRQINHIVTTQNNNINNLKIESSAKPSCKL